MRPSVASWNTSVQLRRVNYLLRASLVEIKLAQFAYVLGAKFDPNQPRVPAGNPDGGQWTGSGGGGDRETFTSDAQRLGTQRSGVQLAGGFTEDQKGLTVQGFVSGYCLGSIHSVLPSQFLDMTIAEVMDLANGGDADARTCLKLLGRDRFRK